MDLKYLNAINILVHGRIVLTQKIAQHFHKNFEQAWYSSDLKRFLPSDAPVKNKIHPDQEWEKLHQKNIEAIGLDSPAYPSRLKQISDPPYILYLQGNKKALETNCFAVVGTRALTEYGERVTPLMVGPLAKAGLTIVSGLARGIDGLAHRAAITTNTPTIAVLGGELGDHSIVLENRKLAKEILQKDGAILSEYPLGISGSKISFPQRNRIISGLSKGVLVIEADEESGSLITAKCALDQNRDVFAIPGSIFSSKSKGPNQLIASGAKLVQSVSDILTDYQLDSKVRQPALLPSNQLEENILKLIGEEIVSLDQIIRNSQKPAPEIISCLMNMELDNKIINLGNNQFSLK